MDTNCLSPEDSERAARYAQDLVQGLAALETFQQGVTVFGSARFPETDLYYQKARELGQKLARAGHAVVTGGGGGIMEAANRGAFEAGGRSIGLNIKLPQEQSPNCYTTDSLEFNYFFARKVMLAFSSKVYVYFPGGFGTLDEFSEILTLMETQKILPAPIILFGAAFWQPLDDFFYTKMQLETQAVSPDDRDLYTITDDVEFIVRVADAILPCRVDEAIKQADTVRPPTAGGHML
ncbi:MAG: TIGR00730 family Rossman fold protein [Actinomycetia bacterium]|nr:TIGR00730 family Rossman fold protein [Actinomycetes bacterium]